ncbi:MAG: nucleotidyltransferase domain-containing protein [Treponema sp.]|nr:nucleotidyltransferase domain-containing protein [Treponema sp.]
MSGDFKTIQDEITVIFLGRLREVFGEDLWAVLIYGSAARGDYRKDLSDINLLILLEKAQARRIAEAGQKTGAFMRKRRISPLIMTREEFYSAADVFPLEYQDIAEAHRVIFGQLGPEDLFPKTVHLRHQMEEKLRGAVGDLRRMLLAAGGNRRLLGKLLLNWSGAGNTLFRGLLRLKGAESAGAGGLLDGVSREYGVSVKGFSDLNRLRAGEVGGKSTGQGETALELADSLLDSLVKLAAAVDAMAEGESR